MKLELNGNSVSDDGQLVATIDGDNATTSRPLPPAVKGRINALAGKKLTFSVVEGNLPDPGNAAGLPAAEDAPTAVPSAATPATEPAKAETAPANPYKVPVGQDPRYGAKTKGWKGGDA